MKHFVLWTAGIVAGLWIAKELRDASHRIGLSKATVDLNQGSREDLLRIPGVSESLADRIIDNRPYRHRLDLVARMVIPSGVYQNIRDQVDVSARAAENAVNVAS
jgi:hypothetical protein